MKDLECLLKCVIEYKKSQLNVDYIGKALEDNSTHFFQNGRRKRIVIVITHRMPLTVLDKYIKKASELLDTDSSLSDEVEIFLSEPTSRKRLFELCVKFQKEYKLSLTIHEGDELISIPQYACFYEKHIEIEETESSTVSKIRKTLYEYMSMNNHSIDIKDGLYNSLLLFQVGCKYPNTISIQELQRRMEEDFQQKNDIRKKVYELRCQKRIISGNSSLEVKLSDNEAQIFKESQKETKLLETEFMADFSKILGIYNLQDVENEILDKLKMMYDSLYNFDNIVKDANDENHGGREGQSLYNFILDKIGDDTKAAEFMQSLEELCARNNYIDNLAANSSFINMYKNNNYEEYINNRPNHIYMDTMVFVYYLCACTNYARRYQNWDNVFFQAMVQLKGIVKESGANIKLYVPFDYLYEAMGEYSKALQIGWIESKVNLTISIESSNTFFNFYRFIKSEKKKNGENTDNYTFYTFASDLDLPTDSINDTFKYDVFRVYKQYSEFNNIEVLDKIEITYPMFDEIKTDYNVWMVNKRGRSKDNETTINRDVRQAFFITEMTEKNDADNHLLSLDNTLVGLRDCLKRKKSNTRSYSVITPSRLIKKITLKTFKIKEHNLTSNLFAYADKSYHVSERIRVIFDNVLSPLFAAVRNPNTELIKYITQMVDSMFVGEFDDTKRNKSIAFENIFSDIEELLPQIGCTRDNLKQYLAAQECNELIKEVIQAAINSEQEHLTADPKNKIAESLKTFVDNMDKIEITDLSIKE